MAATPYAVTFDPSINTGSRDNVMGAVVVAESSADAKALLKSLHGDAVDAGWDNATYTAMAAGADLAGWTARAVVHEVDGTVAADVTVTGAASATVDSIAALLVTALNATTAISNAAYNTSTNVLTVAGTSDAMGDGHFYLAFSPPGSTTAVPGFVGSHTEGGSNGAALSAPLAADSYTVPKVTMKFKDQFN
jgi:hypothetical protein